MGSPYCNCEDWPCCGHGTSDGSRPAGAHPMFGHLDPEDGPGWYDGLDYDEQEFVDDHMEPCPRCGEYRPVWDESMRLNGCCHMCSQDDQRERSPQAARNLAGFAAKLRDKDERIEALEEEVARLRADR